MTIFGKHLWCSNEVDIYKKYTDFIEDESYYKWNVAYKKCLDCGKISIYEHDIDYNVSSWRTLNKEETKIIERKIVKGYERLEIG